MSEDTLDLKESITELLNEYWWARWQDCKEQTSGAPDEKDKLWAERFIERMRDGTE